MKMKGFSIISGRKKLRGIIFNNNVKKPTKTVIISHGYASNMLITSPYAKTFIDEGYVVIMYDFCCSGSGISCGKSTDMSIFTETKNLIDVLDFAKTLDIVDKDRITLCGCSQGGLVSALAGVKREADVERLILYYPALCIPDDARRGCVIGTKINPENIPDKFFGLFILLSKKYVLDARSIDPYEQICKFKKPVLIIHGIEDRLVKIEYSQKAKKLYPDCKLVEIQGDHGFILKGLSASNKVTKEYLLMNDK